MTEQNEQTHEPTPYEMADPQTQREVDVIIDAFQHVTDDDVRPLTEDEWQDAFGDVEGADRDTCLGAFAIKLPASFLDQLRAAAQRPEETEGTE